MPCITYCKGNFMKWIRKLVKPYRELLLNRLTVRSKLLFVHVLLIYEYLMPSAYMTYIDHRPYK
jgi:hypothetical protein